MRAEARETQDATADPADRLAGAIPRLRAFAISLARDMSLADDLVQETILKAWSNLDKFDPRTNLDAWLFTILRNTFINRYHRANRNRAATNDLEAQLPSIGVEAAVGHPTSGTPSPEAALSARITREHIMTALESVPEDYRMAVILADLEGLAYKEIAEIMDCPIGTVMSRIFRGRRLLHKLLHDHAVELGLAQPGDVNHRDEHSRGKTVHIDDYRMRGQA